MTTRNPFFYLYQVENEVRRVDPLDHMINLYENIAPNFDELRQLYRSADTLESLRAEKDICEAVRKWFDLPDSYARRQCFQYMTNFFDWQLEQKKNGELTRTGAQSTGSGSSTSLQKSNTVSGSTSTGNGCGEVGTLAGVTE